MRRLYKLGGITQAELGKRFGGSQSQITGVVTGASYAYLPGAVPKHMAHLERRKYTDEVVLFMRLTYDHCPNVSLTTLSKAFGSPVSMIQRILNGEHYRDVPGALSKLKLKGKVPRMTDDEVIAARRAYRTRYVSIPTLAREAGITRSSMARVIRGLAYKHLPYAVPEHIKTMKRGIKIGPRRSPTKPQQEHEGVAVGLEAHE